MLNTAFGIGSNVAKAVRWRKFRASTGRTPMEEAQAIRLRRIKQLLVESPCILPDIAEQCGFAYHEYMSRFFKKHTGLTPGSYRKKYGKA